jgi:hypothetical protein
MHHFIYVNFINHPHMITSPTASASASIADDMADTYTVPREFFEDRMKLS